ncbi:MAG: tetratricopeptide repeat protein [Bacteroidota bacterium]|jgi:tetratricopeptide (TPR) repeat protein
MRKIMLSSALLLFSLASFAQKHQVVSAYNYLKNNELNEAKAAIDEAAKNEQTIGLAKTWVYRGQVYSAIALDTTGTYNVPDALDISLSSFKEGGKLDTKKEFEEDISRGVEGIAFMNFNRGVIPYNNKEFELALKHFNAVSEAYDFLNQTYNLGIVDTTAMFYGAFAATGCRKYDIAKNKYETLLSANHKKPEIFQGLEVIALSMGDTLLALQYIEQGRTMFPDNNQLMFDELNIYLAQNKTQEVLNKLKDAIAKNPSSVELNYVLGNKYDSNLKDTANAIKYYEAALKIKPDFFDALYSAGALYYNQAVNINDVMNKLGYDQASQKKYNILEVERDKMFSRALPYFERAYAVDASDKDTKSALREIYTRLKMDDKLSNIK